MRARPSPKQQGLPRHDHVLAIDLVSPTMAYVKLKCAIPPRFFTDQLSLLKIDGQTFFTVFGDGVVKPDTLNKATIAAIA